MPSISIPTGQVVLGSVATKMANTKLITPGSGELTISPTLSSRVVGHVAVPITGALQLTTSTPEIEFKIRMPDTAQLRIKNNSPTVVRTSFGTVWETQAALSGVWTEQGMAP